MNRRSSAIAIGVAFVVCASTATAGSGQRRALEGSIVAAYVGGTLQAALQQCAFDTFQKRYDVKVNYVAGASPGQNLARVAAERANPTIDVILTGDPEQYIGTHRGFFERLPYSSIPNSKFIPAKERATLRNGGFDKSGIPVFRQISGIQYNTKVFAENGWSPPTSWTDLWNPRYHGHVNLYRLTTANLQALLVLTAKLRGGGYARIEPGVAQLETLRANNLIVQSAALMDNGYQNGSVWISQNTGARAVAGKNQGLPVEFVQPKEGVFAFNLYADLVKNSKSPNASRLFINWLLTSPVQRCLAVNGGLAPIDPKVAASIPNNITRYVLPQKKIATIDWATVQHNLSKWVKLAPWLT